MSRIGRAPIVVPPGVTVDIEENVVTVKGPKGTLSRALNNSMALKLEDGNLSVSRPNDELASKSLHGLSRTLVNNMIVGVTSGYTVALDIVGVGFKADKVGNNVTLKIGFSHPVEIIPLEGVTLDVENQTRIKVSGIDKEAVGRQAAKIRSIRKPDPYKGKGIRYSTEKVITKAGKSVGKGAK